MEEGILFKGSIDKQGGSIIIRPRKAEALLDWAELQVGDEVILAGRQKSKGKFITMWKKKGR